MEQFESANDLCNSEMRITKSVKRSINYLQVHKLGLYLAFAA